MSDAKKQVVERACNGDNVEHLHPTKKNRHTDGHCVPCCEAIRDFGKSSTVAATLAQQHIRYMKTPIRKKG
jgi:hypothetical protein